MSGRSIAELAKSGKLSLKDSEIVKCPYAAYDYLLEEAPVYYDAGGDFYVVTRYDDLRAALKDTTLFNSDGASAKHRASVNPERNKKIEELFEEKGWPRERPIGNYEGAEHRDRRVIFESFLRASKAREYDDVIENIANSLVDSFVDDGHAEIVSQFSELLSIKTICHLLNAPDDAIPIVKRSMDAMLANIGGIMTDEEAFENARREIEAQRYFKAMIDRLRETPEDTLLSALVNAKLPSGEMTDAQLLRHVMLDMFMAGAETSAKAITSGVLILARNPELRAEIAADIDGKLQPFIEEVLRLEGPASQATRIAVKDVELHGVAIPKGSMVIFRLAAANRDARKFGCPADLDITRKNAAQHLSFGSGPHACVGAPLARRELWYGFKALFERIEDIALAPDATINYIPNMVFRGIDALRITFQPRADRPKAK
ncbi:cytochrome P450 [Sphingobium sp. JS3065]|uniref:cytochrome P450 n=1 Tax=Sphingobium sp. JS3065 TaxID=2970925 RepID=UPI002264422C|nr:cytochrome P450 [Sphingobium sp. JS3065]UZW53814.1 cytochrome P450 [Sphingobium sp. JS3065]